MSKKRAPGRSLDEWMDLVTECRQSGLTDAAWCNALYLVYLEDMSYRDTAEVMGRSESQIKNLVNRGKKSLKEILGKNGFEY